MYVADILTLGISLPLLTVTGTLGLLGASLALGIRHGIDWDHIAAITDITSTSAGVTPSEKESRWLTGEPGVMLTDESHHGIAHAAQAESVAVAERAPVRVPVAAGAGAGSYDGGDESPPSGVPSNGRMPAIGHMARRQKAPMLLATMYALGHGSVVFVLGLLAIVANQVLPGWIDPIMQRVVGVTLLLLAAYLFFSVFQYFRGGQEFRIRSRWMLVFAGIQNGWEAVRSRVFGKPRAHVHEAQQYGVKTAYGIGMIHGIGAETGTQVVIITAAAGAGSTGMSVLSLGVFIVGLLVSNTVVALMTTVGFVSAKQRQSIYVAVGLFAAVFSLFVGTYFLLQSADALPNLDQYFRWIGGGKVD